MKERTAETAAAIIALLVFWVPSLVVVWVGIDVVAGMEYPPNMFELAACLLVLFWVPVLFMKQSLGRHPSVITDCLNLFNQTNNN